MSEWERPHKDIRPGPIFEDRAGKDECPGRQERSVGTAAHDHIWTKQAFNASTGVACGKGHTHDHRAHPLFKSSAGRKAPPRSGKGKWEGPHEPHPVRRDGGTGASRPMNVPAQWEGPHKEPGR